MNPRSKPEPIYIRRADTKNLRQTMHKFIQREYYARFGTTPPLSSVMFGAYQGKKLVGTVGLDVSGGKRKFPIEILYYGPVIKAEFSDGGRMRMAQFGKWRALVSGISGALIYAAIVYSLSQGKKRGCFIAKPKAAARMKSFGIRLRWIRDARLAHDAIPTGDKKYYASKPPPRCYFIKLMQAKTALERQLLSHWEKAQIIFQA